MQPKSFTLQNKLRNYSLLAGSALAAAGTANAQIIYQPVNIVLHPIAGMHATHAIDLNGDGTPDFDIGWNHGTPSGQSAYVDFGKSTGTHPWNRNAAVAGTVTGGGMVGLPNPYSSNQKIGSGNKWFGYQQLEASVGANYNKPLLAQNTFRNDDNKNGGKWSELNDKYMALRLKSSGHYYYGWLRLSVGQNGNPITIVDYAYQSTPDSSIMTGQTSTGVSIHPLRNVTVYSSDKNMFVRYPGAQNGITITVNDMLGKEVKTVYTTNGFYEMNLADAADGIYTVSVRSKEAEFTKKISIQ
jgi:hypothetical protein